MDNWGEFQTVGDENRARQPQRQKHSWISWLCLVVFLSAAGVLLATFALRVLILLTIGLTLGWFGRSALTTTLDIDGKTWAMMIGIAVAVQLCWQVGQLAVPRYGETAGGMVAFICTNILVGSAIGIAQFRQTRREQAEKIEKQAYEEKLRVARKHILAMNAKRETNT